LLIPTAYTDQTAGSILFGGYDPSKYTGQLVPLPIVANPADPDSLSVTWSSISITRDFKTTPLKSSSHSLPYPALLDSGTSVIGVPPDIFTQLENHFSLQFDNGTGNWLADCNIGKLNGTVDFGFKGVNIPVKYEQLVQPVGDGSGLCNFGIQPPPPGQSNFLVLGEPFLRSAYVLFNFEEEMISLAPVKRGGKSKRERGDGAVML